MKNYEGILKDVLTLTNVALAELERGNTDSAKDFIEHIKEGIELNIS